MTLVDDVLSVARSQIGQAECVYPGHDAAYPWCHGRNNHTPYWAEMDPAGNANRWPYCACGASWCLKHGGAALPTIDIPDGFISVYSGANWFANHGLLTHTPAPGLVVLYSFGQGHCGIVEKANGDGTHFAIEWNTSPDDGGSQDNGGGVYRRHRSSTDHVIGFGIPPAYRIAPSPVPVPKPQEDEVKQFIIHGKGGAYLTDLVTIKRPIKGDKTVAAYKAVGVPEVDGVLSDEELNQIPGG